MDFIQTKEHYRFSSDALLLADFVSMHLSKNIFSKKRGIEAPFLFLDIGCGCGVVGIQVLKNIQKNYPQYLKDCFILGLDKEKKLVENANVNAAAFGFRENYHAVCAEIGQGICDEMVQNWAFEKIENLRGKRINAPDGVRKNPRLFDAIMMNPPWYNEKRGKVSEKPVRRDALFGDETTMSKFLNFTGKKLKKRASLFIVGKSANFTDCMKSMPASLKCTSMQNVHARQGVEAVFFLLEARFLSKADIVFPPPLFLNERDL